DPLQAAHVDGDHRRAVGACGAGERFHPARGAEEMLDLVGVEAVLRQPVLALQDGEIGRRREGEDAAPALAIGTVAGDRLRKIDVDTEANVPAMAASFVVHGVCPQLSTTLAALSGSSWPKARW